MSSLVLFSRTTKKEGLTAVIRLGVLLLTALTMGCSTWGNLAPLRQTLGSGRIEWITADVLAAYEASRRPSEGRLDVQDSFWRAVRPDVETTVGPVEGAENFLREGFRSFVQAMDVFVSEKYPDRGEVVFNAFEYAAYRRRETCALSPCKVPPCCGDGARCWRCPEPSPPPK